METLDKIIVASNEEIDSIKLLILGLEKKHDKNNHDYKMMETAKDKLKALNEKEIVIK
jgi:FtsZ-binding cell division protein ZapB